MALWTVESSGGNVLGELDTIVVGLSQDIEAIMQREIEEVRVEATFALMLQGMAEKLWDVLGPHIEEEDSEEADQEPSMDSTIAGILGPVEEATSFVVRPLRMAARLRRLLLMRNLTVT